MNTAHLLHLIFYIAFIGASIWLPVSQFQYYQQLRKVKKLTDTSLGELMYTSRPTGVENERFFSDLFSTNLKDNKLRMSVINLRLSFLAIFLTICAGIVIFNAF